MDNTIEQKTNPAEPLDIADIKGWVAKVGTNPSALEFPTDRWGFTSGIKKEVLRAASTIRGQDDKEALIVAVIAILLQHIRVRHAADKEFKALRADIARDAANERAPRERVGADPVDPSTL